MTRKTMNRGGKTCRVTFELPAGAAATKVSLCGEFNDWSPDVHLLLRRKDGSFGVSISLPIDRTYRYRFLLDGARWENDWNADGYVPNAYGTEDSLLVL
jgi:1,4-alpha-glucan branching enzyme